MLEARLHFLALSSQCPYPLHSLLHVWIICPPASSPLSPPDWSWPHWKLASFQLHTAKSHILGESVTLVMHHSSGLNSATGSYMGIKELTWVSSLMGMHLYRSIDTGAEWGLTLIEAIEVSYLYQVTEWQSYCHTLWHVAAAGWCLALCGLTELLGPSISLFCHLHWPFSIFEPITRDGINMHQLIQT